MPRRMTEVIAAANVVHALESVPRLAWAWADGWERAERWQEIAGTAINWLREGQQVLIVKHAPLGQPSLAGRIGTITTVHRETFLGEVVVTVPPRGRQKNPREVRLRIGTGAFEPID